MKKKKLIAIYKQFVYDDGSIEFERLDLPETLSNSCSARITQCLELVENFVNIYTTELGADFCWSSCIKKISRKYCINQASVIDKATRQIGFSSTEIKMILVDICKNPRGDSSKKLIERLKSFAPNAPTKTNDLIAIDNFFNSIMNK